MKWSREPNAIGRSDYVSGDYRISPREQESDPASVGYHITQWDVSYRGVPIGLENSLRSAKVLAVQDAEVRCDCMTELDDRGEERVLTHSLRCPLHPEYEAIDV